MSTRWYPLYQKGNPQLRVFLPNFWMKLVKPSHKQPPNVVEFHCSMEMTKYDVKNYLEKIYNVKLVDVRTRIALGKICRNLQGYTVKCDDIKIAYAILPKDEVFVFPEINQSKNKSAVDEIREKVIKHENEVAAGLHGKFNGPGMPEWFS